MFYKFLYMMHDVFSPLNVFRYITFRTALAVMTAMIFSLLIGPAIIQRLKKISIIQQIRDDGPQSHLSKKDTPTMGGIIIVLSILVTIFLWGDLSNSYVLITLGGLVGYSAIGFYDDYLKVIKKNSKGLKVCYKFGAQILLALGISIILYLNPSDPYNDLLSVPFLKHWLFDLGWFYVPFSIVVIVGSSNAVNLTDGIDGLAIGLVGIASIANMILVYISGNIKFADYLQVMYLQNTGELTVFCGALLGASLGFLWFNSYPAEVFMGDTGSLGLGGALGTLAVITKHEIVLAVVGGIFVVETLSVVLQVASFKFTGRRILRMAPVHHHFELKGWHESKVIVRFWIVGIMLALLSLATLKLR